MSRRISLRSIFFETPSMEKIIVGASSGLATRVTQSLSDRPASLP
jgi:hypothetical protein